MGEGVGQLAHTCTWGRGEQGDAREAAPWREGKVALASNEPSKQSEELPVQSVRPRCKFWVGADWMEARAPEEMEGLKRVMEKRPWKIL